jgi:N-acetyl-gamma-glutamyl-phosphate reductase
MLKVAIIGGSGYTGFELLRILAVHPHTEVAAVSSRQNKGRRVCEVFPSLKGFYDNLSFTAPEDFPKMDAEFFFCALPHGASMEVVDPLVGSGKKVVDLSADFRLRDADLYKKWYGEHKSKELLKEAVYGLPELNRDSIKGARLVANPGCYPTAAILSLAPLVNGGLIDTGSIIIDSKSGVSGAGRSASIEYSFVEVASGFKAYKVGCHRHTPEIEQELGLIAGREVTVTFTPHLIPTPRGILTTVYADLEGGAGGSGGGGGVTSAAIRDQYLKFYEGEPFVRIMPEGEYPDIKDVRCSNYFDIGFMVDEKRGKLIVISAMDNLVKGASGQAVQNMNIMNSMEETSGLVPPPVSV